MPFGLIAAAAFVVFVVCRFTSLFIGPIVKLTGFIAWVIFLIGLTIVVVEVLR